MVKWQLYARRRPFYKRPAFLGGVGLILLLAPVFTLIGNNQNATGRDKAAKVESATPFMFGVGTELDHAINHRITKEAPVKMLTSWYNSPKDLEFMNKWRGSLVPMAHASGYSLHLIVFNDDPEQNLTTKYGPACGRPYPLSSRFISDMQQLAQTFRGGRLYVSMFTEVQTYPCEDNMWKGSENYYKALQDQYRAAMSTFHLFAPGSQVSLSWGGWQANWDDVGRQGGMSLFKHFEGVMNESDFQSFQAMDTVDNVYIIRNMTHALKPYKGKTMLSHYKPDNRSQSTFNADMRTIFTPNNIIQFKHDELFAFSFMDTENMHNSESAYQTVKKIVQTHTQ